MLLWHARRVYNYVNLGFWIMGCWRWILMRNGVGHSFFFFHSFASYDEYFGSSGAFLFITVFFFRDPCRGLLFHIFALQIIPLYFGNSTVWFGIPFPYVFYFEFCEKEMLDLWGGQVSFIKLKLRSWYHFLGQQWDLVVILSLLIIIIWIPQRLGLR